MKYVFIAFYGYPTPPMNQNEKIFKISKDFECWNLRKFSPKDFIKTIKKKIPPVNKNVLRNYLTSGSGNAWEGIKEEQYEQCLWGLLLPNVGEYNGGYPEALALLNLFSPKYMHPAFYVSHMGITRVSDFKQNVIQPNTLQGYDHFKTKKFVSFYKTMIEQTKYFMWNRYRALAWTDEDWRLYMASIFYMGFEQYEKSKSSYTWQRESADMATLLETLFTAGDSQNEEIGYRLRKRVGVLIGWNIPNIETDLKKLYSDRSEFVHGSYYRKIIKGMKSNKYDKAMLPPPDFEKLYKSKESLRKIFIAYLYLSKVKSKNKYLKVYNSVQTILEEAILNMALRNKVISLVKPIIKLL